MRGSLKGHIGMLFHTQAVFGLEYILRTILTNSKPKCTIQC